VAQEAETPASLYNQGLEFMKAKDYEKAFEFYKRALSIATPGEDDQVIGLSNKNGAIAAYYLGSKLSKADKNEEAMQVLQDGIKMNPDFYANYSSMGSILNDQDEVVKAVEAYLKAAEARMKTGRSKPSQTLNALLFCGFLYFSDCLEILRRQEKLHLRI